MAATGLGASAGLAGAGEEAGFAGAAAFGVAGFAAGLAGVAAFGAGADFDASLAGAAAAFIGAALAVVVFFGAEDAADLLVAADLGFVLTVLAFSLLVDDTGAVDLAALGFAAAAGRAAPVFATGDFVCFDAGEEDGVFVAVSAPAADTSLVAFSEGAASLMSFTLATLAVLADVGSALTDSTTLASLAAGAELLAVAPSGALAAISVELSASTDFDGAALASATGAFWAAASISEEVMTLRFAGAASETDGTDAGADLDDDVVTGFFTVFPDAFFLETAIASTS